MKKPKLWKLILLGTWVSCILLWMWMSEFGNNVNMEHEWVWKCECAIVSSLLVLAHDLEVVFHGIKFKNPEKPKLWELTFLGAWVSCILTWQSNIVQMVRANFTWTKDLRPQCWLEGS